MKISLVEVRNYLGLKHADVRPGDRNVVTIGGKNRAGKTSLLSAFEVALGGPRHQPPEPVYHGARRAAIHMEFDDGDLVIDRIIDREGRHKLEVHTKDGKQKSPQTMLDALVGARFLDPLTFLGLKPKAQRDLLVQVADIDVDLEELAKERSRDYDERRNVNRDLKRTQATADQLGPDEDPIVVTPAAELLAAMESKRAEGAARKAAVGRVTDADDELGEATAAIVHVTEDIAEAERDLDRMKQELEKLKLRRTEQAAAVDASPPAEQLATELEQLTAQASKLAEDAGTAAAIDERNTQRTQARGDVERLEGVAEELTESIDALDQTKADALERAKMPISGLTIDDERVIYNGSPFEQVAKSEQLQAALAIAAALSKEIRDVWLRDASLLDGDSRAAIEKFAEESGCRVWIECVGEDDSEALIIQEGELREAAPDASE